MTSKSRSIRSPAEPKCARREGGPTCPPTRRPPGQGLLDRYLAGWAAADPLTVIQATAPGYRFHDPSVGLFTRWSLPQYFERLQAQRLAAAAITQSELSVLLQGPIDPTSHRLDLQFWRSASPFGATGLAHIAVGERGVMSETISYDVGPPFEALRSRTIRHVAQR